MAQDSENKFEVKIDLEPSTNGAVPTGMKPPERAVEDYVKDIERIDKNMPSASSELDRALSPGYNPNAMMSNTGAKQSARPSSLPRKNDNNLEKKPNKPAPNEESRTTPTEKVNPNEQAPDVNKDYGSPSLPNTPRPNRSQNESPTAKNNNAGNNTGNNTGNNDPSANANNPENENPDVGGTLPRKNDLTDDKDQDKNQDQAQDKDNAPDEKKDTPGENPEGADKQGDKANTGQEKNPEAPNDLDKEKIDKQNDAATGNGYGALRNRSASKDGGDKTDRVRQNMDHQKRMQQGEDDEKKKRAASSSGSINDKVTPSLGARIKDRFRNLLSGKAPSKDDVSDNSNGRNDRNSKNPFNKALGAAKNAIFNFLKANPHIAVILAVIILIFLILMITNLTDEMDKNGNNNGKCNYSLNGVLSTGSVELEGIQVELVNCDAKPGNYTVLENVDFEKYVVGVALAEIGFSKDNPEYFKTGIIAARNFALTRNTSMCPSNPDDCFYGYNQSSGKIRMRACEADQVYWDYDKDIYRQDRGAISLYSPEINSGSVWKRALDETTKEDVLTIADEVKGKVLLDSSGNVVHTDYINTDQQEWSRLASEGHTYDEILSIHYGGGSVSGATCSSGNIDYGDYVLSSDGHTILHEPLDSFLSKNGTSLEAFNGLIEKNVKKAGYGTRAGVVAAAVTLIAELGNNYNVKVPYYWGGGHADGVVDGALGYWGSTQCHTYANNQSYNYCGLDCSGFVPWAIKNGGFNIAQMLAGNFQNMSGVQRVSLSSSPVLEPGDLLESSGHIVLVVGIEESTGNYICAEASGNAAGVLFTRRPFGSSGYWGVKMDGFYATHQRSE